jgi:hypothetical protein
MKHIYLIFLLICISHGNSQTISKNDISKFEDFSHFFNNECCQFARNVITNELEFEYKKLIDSTGLWAISSLSRSTHFIFLSKDSLYLINMHRPLKIIIDEYHHISKKVQLHYDESIHNNCLKEIIRIHEHNYYYDNGNQRISIPKYDPNFWYIDSVKIINTRIYEDINF